MGFGTTLHSRITSLCRVTTHWLENTPCSREPEKVASRANGQTAVAGPAGPDVHQGIGQMKSVNPNVCTLRREKDKKWYENIVVQNIKLYPSRICSF